MSGEMEETDLRDQEDGRKGKMDCEERKNKKEKNTEKFIGFSVTSSFSAKSRSCQYLKGGFQETHP